jgi:hypothetical protein
LWLDELDIVDTVVESNTRSADWPFMTYNSRSIENYGSRIDQIYLPAEWFSDDVNVSKISRPYEEGKPISDHWPICLNYKIRHPVRPQREFSIRHDHLNSDFILAEIRDIIKSNSNSQHNNPSAVLRDTLKRIRESVKKNDLKSRYDKRKEMEKYTQQLNSNNYSLEDYLRLEKEELHLRGVQLSKKKNNSFANV